VVTDVLWINRADREPRLGLGWSERQVAKVSEAELPENDQDMVGKVGNLWKGRRTEINPR